MEIVHLVLNYMPFICTFWVPIKQCYAVTGSVNQKGDVQAIGGVNYKIEGFYEVCKSKDLPENKEF